MDEDLREALKALVIAHEKAMELSKTPMDYYEIRAILEELAQDCKQKEYEFRFDWVMEFNRGD